MPGLRSSQSRGQRDLRALRALRVARGLFRALVFDALPAPLFFLAGHFTCSLAVIVGPDGEMAVTATHVAAPV